MTKLMKFIVEKHAEGYVAYPVGLKGVVGGQGATYADVQSAVVFRVKSFGAEVREDEKAPMLEAFVAQTAVAV